MFRIVVTYSLLLSSVGCSKIFGFNDPQLDGDAGVNDEAGVDDAGVDAPNAPLTIPGVTSIGPAGPSTGNVQVLDPRFEIGPTVCSQNNQICIRGGLTP